MAITNGFTATYSDAVTIDQTFGTYPVTNTSVKKFVSTYVLLVDSGNLVYINEAIGASALPQYINNAAPGLYPISATKILSGATVNGTPRTTTVTDMTWFADTSY